MTPEELGALMYEENKKKMVQLLPEWNPDSPGVSEFGVMVNQIMTDMVHRLVEAATDIDIEERRAKVVLMTDSISTAVAIAADLKLEPTVVPGIAKLISEATQLVFEKVAGRG